MIKLGHTLYLNATNNYSEKRRERTKKKKKTHSHTKSAIMTLLMPQENLNETNKITQMVITNGDQNG